MEPLVRGTTDEIQTFFAFVVGKGLRAQRLPVKVGKETTVGKNDKRALPDRCERRKSFCGRRILECDQRYVREKGEPVQITTVEGLAKKVKPET